MKSFKVRFGNWRHFEIYHYRLCSNSGKLINKTGKERHQSNCIAGLKISLSICITLIIQHCNKKGKHSRGEIFTQRPDPAPSGRPGAGPDSEIQVVWREGHHGFLPLLHFLCSPLLQTQAYLVRWERSWSIPESPQAQGFAG